MFRLIVATLLPLGLWLCLREPPPAADRPTTGRTPRRGIIALALGVGAVGGVYGIGGGSILGPILVGRVPERGLRRVLGGLAAAVAILYAG